MDFFCFDLENIRNQLKDSLDERNISCDFDYFPKQVSKVSIPYHLAAKKTKKKNTKKQLQLSNNNMFGEPRDDKEKYKQISDKA